MKFTKATYKITESKNGRIQIDERTGYIFQTHGICFGVCKRECDWAVTELKTGFLTGYGMTRKEAAENINEEICKKIKNAYKGAQKYIDMIATA